MARQLQGSKHSRSQQDDRYYAVFNQIPDPIFVFDKETKRFLDFNRAVLSKYGYTDEELRKMTPYDLHPREEHGLVEMNIDAKNVITANSYTHRDKYGTAFKVEILTDEIEYEGKQAWLSIVRDVTANQQTEALLRKAKAEAETANRTKSEFVANISHEIRTPMNGVIGMASVLLDTTLTEEQREYAETIVNSAEALLAIINDILDFSKVDAGKIDIEPIPFNLNHCVLEIASLLAEKAAQAGIELIVRYPSETQQDFIGDPGRIRQVLTNLLGNAIKFTEQGHVLLSVVITSETDHIATVEFTVEDSGIGIAPEQLEKIFDKFTQADSSMTREYGGTGLGLSISKQLVELMGGQIQASSEPGKGSCFKFTLPLQLNSKVISGQLPMGKLENTRILIVDDNEVNRRVLLENTSGWQMRSHPCASATEALDELVSAARAGDPYEIAIIDFCMPVINGEELGKFIKADPRLRDTRLLMLTSIARRGDVGRLKEIGFAAYLTKPCNPNQLREVLTTLSAMLPGESASELVTRHSVSEAKLKAGAVEQTSSPLAVLLAEDNIVNQKVAAKMLKNLGCQVSTATNGREALQLLESAHFDIIFMDCHMPDLDGYETTEQIRSRKDSTREIPIVAITAKAMLGDREQCLNAGMDDYISKPINMAALRQKLEKWVMSRKEVTFSNTFAPG